MIWLIVMVRLIGAKLLAEAMVVIDGSIACWSVSKGLKEFPQYSMGSLISGFKSQSVFFVKDK